MQLKIDKSDNLNYKLMIIVNLSWAKKYCTDEVKCYSVKNKLGELQNITKFIFYTKETINIIYTIKIQDICAYFE